MESLGNPISDLTEFLLLANPGSGARAYDQGIAHTELHHPQTHPRSNERCLASYAGWEGPNPTRDTTTLTDSVYSGAESENTDTDLCFVVVHSFLRTIMQLTGE